MVTAASHPLARAAGAMRHRYVPRGLLIVGSTLLGCATTLFAAVTWDLVAGHVDGERWSPPSRARPGRESTTLRW
jgi:hypothetical protein